MLKRKKIKNMTPKELKNYRFKKCREKKLLEEKELKAAERAKKQKAKIAIKTARTRKKNKVIAVKEEKARQKKLKAAAKKSAITKRKNKVIAAREEKARKKKFKAVAKKSAITRRKNIIAAKKAERANKKAKVDARRAERDKNKIVFDHKPTKEMNEDEYKEYKKEYARRYNERKRQVKESSMNNRVISKLSGKAKTSFECGYNHRTYNNENRFVDIKENKRYPMNPLVKGSLFTLEGVNVYCEMSAAVNLINLGKTQLVKVSLSIFVIPNFISNSYIKIQDFWKKDVTDKIEELTTSNYSKIIQPITTEKYQDLMNNWTTIDFIKTAIRHGHRNKIITAEILWDCLEHKYSKENNISMKTLMQMAKPLRKNKKY